MIYVIILIAAGLIIGLLAGIATTVILRNNRLERDKTALKGQIAALFKDNAALTDALDEGRRVYNELQQENVALNARNTVPVEALEARPTQPAKRTVRKNSTAGEQP